MGVVLAWLYPEQLNLYGDRGNIESLERRLQWRGIPVKTIKFQPGDDLAKIEDADLFFAGGGPDSLQRVVSQDAPRLAPLLNKACQQKKAGLFICGFYQLLGRYYRPAEGDAIKGLAIFPCYTQHFGKRKKRCVGNIVTYCDFLKEPLVGFENHEGRTFLDKKEFALATVKKGYGNNDKDKTEGIKINNFLGTYLHGPLLPKNPRLADWLLAKALKKKRLPPLDDSLEQQARANAQTLS